MRRAAPTWRVYMLRCCDGSLYTGATSDLARRLDRHAAGVGARYTRSRLPVILVYEERARDRGAALRREAFLKRLTRAQKVALVDGAGERRAGAVTPGHRRPARRRRRGPAPAAAR